VFRIRTKSADFSRIGSMASDVVFQRASERLAIKHRSLQTKFTAALK
jgi:hypothetical protein